ncbi:MAG: murein hydrolase activator EnvC family protein [Candidatus Kryptoniota bacterium]
MNVKKEELQKLRGNIKLYQKRIAENSNKESASLETLDNFEKQNLRTRQAIKKISNQIGVNSSNIADVKRQISTASSKLSGLTDNYASFARSYYKRGRLHDLELILTASSINEMLVRYEYLKKFSDQTKTDMDLIASERDRLNVLREQLNRRLAQQQNYLGEKSTEEMDLSTRIVQQKDLIVALRRNKKAYAEQLERSQTAAGDLENLIRTLIAQEAAEKKEAERRAMMAKIAASRKAKAKASSMPQVPDIQPSAEIMPVTKGHLPWPVSRGKIIARFGEHENPVLKTITLNYGIDISVPENCQVKSVADGEVSRIFWLPSYGNLIIINNYNGLRTVYSHLADIFVKEGDKVKAGEPIGAVGESLGGSILHFEVWLQKDKQDPEAWLSKK